MTAPNTGKAGTPAYASMWSRMIAEAVGRLLHLELMDGTTCVGRLERLEAGRAIVTVDGRARVIDLDQLRAIVEVEGDE